jgi:protein SCO1
MDEGRRSLALLALKAGSLVGLGSSLLPAMRGRAEKPGLPGTGSRSELRARYFPNLAFRRQDGRRVRFYDDLIEGKKVLINFMYTECANTCPRTTANLVKVQDAFGDRVGRDVFMVSISLTPERDTPERLQAYSRTYGCRKGWDFVTGRTEDVDRLRLALGLYDSPDVTQHLGLLTFGNEPEARWGATSVLASPEQIVWEVKNRIDGWTDEPWPSRTAT